MPSNRAITLDQAAPLPRLGLGLAKIRKGELTAGREEIEIAVILDPGNSLIRSYMGKAYYEEKRDKLAATQYEMAKELDPNDPTPWFYDAIRKQTGNRPVEALHDLQESIRLNDNRAVYRSRLELDADLATRSASIARIYNDLGFDQRALVEGWQSVNTDPGNFSAHRLLADSYASLPRHEVARVSELLQSQLLQPINLNPVQPQLAETNLSFLENAGPSDPSFLEFNPLFTSNRLALQASGIAGSNDTWGDDLIQNGVYNNWSWSIGQFHYESDGYRDNNDQDQNTYNLFVQGALSWKTSVQFELRHQEIESGDLVQRFEPDNFLENDRNSIDSDTYRLGLHHEFKPGNEIIASYVHKDTDEKLETIIPVDFGPFGSFDIDATLDGSVDGDTSEIQHIFKSTAFKLVSGIGYFDGTDKLDSTLITTPPPPPFLGFIPGSILSVRDRDIRHKNAYVYSYIPAGDKLLLTAGASYDDLDSDATDQSTIDGFPTPATKDDISVNKLSPKLGVTWQVRPDTTLRAAAFKTVTRELISNQTIEPTQVAGFNQLYDDSIGTVSKRYGIAADHIFTDNLSAGTEYTWRDLEVPLAFADESEVDWKERFARAYLYWTPHPRLSGSIEYQYERFSQDSFFTGAIQAEHLSTHRLPIGLNYFHPNGFIGRIRTTYYDQQGDFSTTGAGFVADAPTEKKSDSFWLVDASLGYRLPKRRGIVSVGVANLFDESFNFVDTDPFNPRIYPDRQIFSRFTLSF